MSNLQKYILVGRIIQNGINYVNGKFKFHIFIEGLNVKKIVNDIKIWALLVII